MTVVNRVLAALLALALLLGGLLAATEIVLARLDRPYWLVPHPQWSAWLREQTLSAGLMRAVLAAVTILGLLLLLAALHRGKPHTLTLPSPTEGVQVSASRRGIERTLRDAAARTSGVSSVQVKAGRRKVKVTAHTAARTPGESEQQVRDVVAGKLDDLGLGSALRPRIRILTGRNR